MAKRERAGRIFIDYLRNAPGSTAVAAYSTRARPGAGVAMPLDWGELDAIGSADHFTLANASRRLNGLGCDPCQAIDTTKQRLPAKRSRTPRRSV
jgi:bifunctional non-homologous end joining protein LigD